MIDDLKYLYDHNNKNLLLKVTDATNVTKGFKDDSDGTNDTEKDYTYDPSGNMVSDQNKKIENIAYNHLNLPTEIRFENGDTIYYIYNAVGQKVAKNVLPSSTEGGVYTNYLDGFQYVNNVLKFFPHAEGYVSATQDGADYKFNYVFSYTDHLGNIRLNYGLDPQTNVLKVLEQNHYYPFGLKHTNYNSGEKIYAKEAAVLKIAPIGILGQNLYKYKFQGQERQDELGLNWDSFKFRNYDFAIARFFNIDPLAEEFSYQSPYNFSENRVIDGVELEGAERLSVHTPGWIYSSQSNIRNEHPTEAQMNSATIAVAMRHPIAAHNVGVVERGGTNISTISSRLTRHVSENGNITQDLGSESNAFRHAVWSGAITSRYGETAAQNIGNAHEGIPMGAKDNAHVDFSMPAPDNLGAADSVVDFLNNSIGREIGKQLGENASEWDVAVSVLDVQLNQGLWTATTDKNGNINIARTKISKKQYDTAMKSLMVLDNNGMNDADREELGKN
jgi:RHS repeat-associated protein